MLIITPEAKKWLDKKGCSAIILERQVVQTHTCSCSNLNYMKVRMGEPTDKVNFRMEIVDGIAVYYSDKIKFPQNRDFRIELSSVLGLKSLKIEGVFQSEEIKLG